MPRRLRDLGFTVGFIASSMLAVALLPVIYSNWTAIIQLRGQVTGIEAELSGVRERVRLLEQRIRQRVAPRPRVVPPRQPEPPRQQQVPQQAPSLYRPSVT